MSGARLYYSDEQVRLFVGDAREALASLPDECVQTCVTSPPYFGLRDYGDDRQIGREATPAEYVAQLTEVLGEVRRVLREDGTLWLNLGDSYCHDSKWGGRSGGPKTALNGGQPEERGYPRASGRRDSGVKDKDLIGIPWRVAFALQEDGWYLRSDVVWSKPNPMPESVKDRPTRSHEYVFLLSKSRTYYYDADAIAEEIAESTRRIHSSPNVQPRAAGAGGWKSDHYGGGHTGLKNGADTIGDGTRNRRSVWTITTKPYPEAHFATFPPELPELCIKAGSPPDGVVLDPFAGAGTTLWRAKELGRQAIGIELNPTYCDLIVRRIAQGVLAL